jgi:hypothetical protein
VSSGSVNLRAMSACGMRRCTAATGLALKVSMRTSIAASGSIAKRQARLPAPARDKARDCGTVCARDAARRTIPMTPEGLLEAAVLIYLDGLGVPPDAG